MGCAKAARRIEELSERFGLAVDPRARTDRLSVGARQRVEILKVLYRGARVLILDEPTTNLTPQEVDDLFASLRVIVAEGTSVVFISHKVREVLAICDRISVMRDGRRLTTVQRSATDATGLASLMVGELAAESSSDARGALGLVAVGEVAPDDGAAAPEVAETAAAPRLTVTDLVVHNDQGVPAVRGVDLVVGAGEVLGVAGVAGNGQVELAEALAGVRPVHTGSVAVDGTDLAGAHTRRWLRLRCRLRARGPAPGRHPRSGVRDRQPPARLAAQPRLPPGGPPGLAEGARAQPGHDRELRDQDAGVARRRRPTCPAATSSALVLARAFGREPSVLVLQNPTRGLDLALDPFVYDRVHEARDRGCAVVLISEDLDELSLLADRIVVLYSGEVVGERAAATTTPTRSAASWPASGRPHDRARPDRARGAHRPRTRGSVGSSRNVLPYVARPGAGVPRRRDRHRHARATTPSRRSGRSSHVVPDRLRLRPRR